MISLIFVFFTVIVQSIPFRTIYFRDGSLIQGRFIIRIENTHVSGGQLRFFSKISFDAVQDRLQDFFATGSYTEFDSEDLILLLPRINSSTFSRHPVDPKVFILRSNSQLVHKFIIHENFYKLIESKRSESCALNYSKFVFFGGNCDSIDDLEGGLSMPFRMTLGDMQRASLKLGIDSLQNDLTEIVDLLHRLKEDGFEGVAHSGGFDQIIVLGIDLHLKLIVPAVVGTKISNLIDLVDQLKCEIIDLFAEKPQFVQQTDFIAQAIPSDDTFNWQDLDLENFEFDQSDFRTCPDQENLEAQESELQSQAVDSALGSVALQNDESHKNNLDDLPISADELYKEMADLMDSQEFADIYSLIN